MKKAVMEKGVMEKLSWIGVMETVRCAASWRRCHGKHGRHGKCHGSHEACSVMERSYRKRYLCHGRVVGECAMKKPAMTECSSFGMSWKSRLGYCYGKQHLCNVMERCHWNQNLLSVTENVSRKASWKQRGAQRHGKALRKAILMERHGIVVTECATESISDHRM